jgi:SAM-dependent methyltransferase
MSAAVATLPTTVAGPANDPHLRMADGSLSRLRFFCDFPPALRVLDVGCGNGEHLHELTARGCQATGLEPGGDCVAALQQQGLTVVQGSAERLPFPDESFNAIVCSVVIPYTDERRAIAEWSRVLKPRGEVRASYHGIGFALGYAIRGPGLRRRVYGVRMVANSWVYGLSGRRLPGFWGDSLCQSQARLARHYRDAGLELIAEFSTPGVGGWNEFLFHHLRKAG